MGLSMNQVVNAQIMPQAMTAARRDLSVLAIFTQESGEVFNDVKTRYVSVSGALEVAELFGSDSKSYAAALQVFAVRPMPKRALIARWIGDKQTIPEKRSSITGSAISTHMNNFKIITDGVLTLPINREIVTVSGLNFSGSIYYLDIAKKITESLPKDTDAQVTWENGSFVVSSIKTGSAAAKIGFAQPTTMGTDLSDLMRLREVNATQVVGQDAVTLNSESISDALNKLENVYQNWYGAYFTVLSTKQDLVTANQWCVAAMSPKVVGYTATCDSDLEWEEDNVLKVIAQMPGSRLMAQFNKTGQDHAGAALLALALNTDWNATNSAKTVKFKQQKTVQSDDSITLMDAMKAERLGLNFYTDYDGVPMLAQGMMIGGQFIDEVVGLDAYIDSVQKQAFSVLQTNPTKIPQTDKGQAVLIGALNVVGQEFVRNGFIAPGVWRGNAVGELEWGDSVEKGYYFYSDSYDLQSPADREARKAMPIMCALKLAGAIHSVDILIQFNR